MKLLLPKYVASGEDRKVKSKIYKQADHFGLKWNKWVFLDDRKKDKPKMALYIRDEKGTTRPYFAVTFNFKEKNGKLIQNIQKQQTLQFEQLKKMGWAIESIDDLKALWRTVIGLGYSSVYEVSMSLHHTYGIPYIPATTLKGVVRSWMIKECFGRSENKALRNPIFKYLFGETDQRGALIWWDAFPQKPPKLRPDVMNVIYPDYYQKQKAPGDWQAANPVYFLTLDRNDAEGNPLRFTYRIGLMPGEVNATLKNYDLYARPFLKLKELNPESTLLDLAKAWLKRALYLHGLGGKTAKGYGRQK